MSLVSDNRITKQLTLSSRCVFNTEFIDSNTMEVVYSTRTPKVWFTRQSVTTLSRHTQSTDRSSGSAIPQPASPNLPEKGSVSEDTSSKSTPSSPLPRYALENGQEQRKEGGNEVEVTKIQWKFFHDTLFEHDFQTKNVNEIMEKTGPRPLRL
jgi:hypothetical protein